MSQEYRSTKQTDRKNAQSLSNTMMELESCIESIENARFLLLVAAAISNLIDDIRGHAETGQRRREWVDVERVRIQREALRFVASDSWEEMSFNWMCDVLGMDSEWFRLAVKTGDIHKWEKREMGNIEYYELKRM